MTVESASTRPKNPRNRDNSYTAYDRALISASQNDKVVYFALANGEVVKGKVCSVDKFQVELSVGDSYKAFREWFNKSLIVRTRIEK